MFDTTLIEKGTSIMMLFTLPMVGLMFPFLFTAIALMGAQEVQGFAISGGIGCCSTAVGLVFSLGLLLIMKRSRSGRARPFLEKVQAEIGGEVVMGNLLWSLLSPRLRGEINGHEYRLSFRRQGGILSAADIGRMFLMWGWSYDLVLTSRWNGTAGFAQEAMPNFGLSLFGISGPTEVHDGLKTFANKSEGGALLVADEQTIEHARQAVTFGRNGCLLRVKSDAIRITGFVPIGATPDDVVALLRNCGNIATRAQALSPRT